MADKKISALTAATTPLGGTEVFPIVQSSATVKATIADVQAAPVSAGTANGVQYLNASKVPTTGAVFTFDGYTPIVNFASNQIGYRAIGSTNGTNPDAGSNRGGVVQLQNNDTTDGNGNAVEFYNSNSLTSSYINGINVSHSGRTGAIVFGVANGGAPSEKWRINATGNLIPKTAATGVNFTANTPAAGMTSQLLNWYEEGTFDPRLSFATGGDTFTYNARIATYTRVGRLVTLNLLIDTSAKGAGTGNLSLINLPFTAAGYASVVPRTVGITNTGPISAYTYSGQSSLLFFTVSSLGVETQITDTSVGAAVTIAMSLTYITS